MSLIHFVIVCPLFFKSHNKAVLLYPLSAWLHWHISLAALSRSVVMITPISCRGCWTIISTIWPAGGVKEYTASFCAGIFEFANPQPLPCRCCNCWPGCLAPWPGFADLHSGGRGHRHLWMCQIAGLNHMSATVSALLMAFSGFILTRMMIGHMTFFNLGFAPLVAMLMLYGVRAFADVVWRSLLPVVVWQACWRLLSSMAGPV